MDSNIRVSYDAVGEEVPVGLPQARRTSCPYFWVVIAALLTAMAFIQISAALQESQTWDEADHLSAGYSYWKTGEFTLNKEHPPLGKLIMALPLLFANVSMPPVPTDPTYANETAFSRAFLYRNLMPADSLLLRARIAAVLITIALGVALAVWTRTAFGPGAALLAVLLFAFDPNVLAHGRYVTTDVIVTLTMFIACITWSRFLEKTSTQRLCVAGVATGLALLSKFSAIVLPFILLALYLVHWWQGNRQEGASEADQPRLSLGHLLRSFIVVGLLSFVVIYAGYAFQTKTLSSQSSFLSRQSDSEVRPSTPSGTKQAALWIVRKVPIPAGPWLLGLMSVLKDSKVGRPLFLAGHSYSTGKWFYFPSVFVMKTPIGTLVLLLLACGLAIGRIAQKGSRRLLWLKHIDSHWYVSTIPVIVFLAFSMRSHVNIGLRHILPVYPFLFAFIAGTLTHVLSKGRRMWLRYAIVTACTALVVESLMIYPHHLAFLNYAFGGPERAIYYISNSDIDWGQDAKGLAKYLSTHQIQQPCVAYAGEADLQYYKIYSRPVPTSQEVGTSPDLDCVVAVSVSNLNARGRLYQWLNRYQPIAKIGYSIYVYDLRKLRH